MYVPPKYMLMAMDTPLSPREAWNQIRGAIQNDGKEAECGALIDWLRVSLTRQAPDQQPCTTVDPLSQQVLTHPQVATSFHNYCNRVFHQDLPEMHLNQVHGAQGRPEHLRNVRRILMQSIDEVLRPPQEGDSPYRKDLISISKLDKGDADWGTVKKILGWIVDTQNMGASDQH